MSELVHTLLVEDDPSYAYMIRELLSAVGPTQFEFCCVDCLSNAVSILSTGEVDLVLLDLGLPDSSGLDTFRAVRAAAPDTPTLVMTGNDDGETALQAVKEGAQDYLVKGRMDGNALRRSATYAVERHRAARAVHASEEKFRILFNAGSDVVFLHGLEQGRHGRFVAVNDEACRRLKYTREQFLVMEPGDVVRSPDEAQDGALGRMLRGGRLLFNTEYRTADGVWFPVEVNAHVFALDGKPMVLSVARDLSERNRAMEALRASEERYRALVDNVPLMVILLDRDLRVKACNAQGREAFPELSRKQEPFCYQVFVDPNQQAPCADCPCHQTFQDGLFHERVVERIIHGRPRTLRVFSSPIRDVAGSVEAVTEVVQDITEQVRADTERHALESQLFQAQKMEAVGRLAGGVAHDFNNLLSIINSYAHFIREGLEAKDPMREDCEEIIQAAQRATVLVRQLLAFSRRQVLQLRVLCLNDVLTGMEKLVRRLIGEDVQLVTELAKDLGNIKADAGQLEQVVMNLAVNARDAMPRGGKLTLETTNVNLSADGAARYGLPSGGYVRLRVTDTGLGMDQDTLAHVFEPFFTSKEKGRGTGLGLATVYGIVQQSSGAITVESQPHKGTTFTILLPLDFFAGEPVWDNPSVLGPNHGHETVLVVEDDEAVRNLVRRILANHGYQVLTACNAGEALLICERTKDTIHLLITDVVMPLMNGRELAERLMRMRPSLKVLYTSGYTDDVISREGVLDTGISFVSKPHDPVQLPRRVREVLDLHS